jgi:hypothetical protein
MHLIIFDRQPGKTWAKRIWMKQKQHNGNEITVWGA